MKLKHRTQIGIILFSAAAILLGLISFIVLEAPRELVSDVRIKSSSEACSSSVSSISEHNTPDDTAATSISSRAEDSRINLNTATQEELMSLDGIGEVLAGRIIAYREQNGGFAAIEELKNVYGIGEKIFEKIRNKITVK